MNPEINPDLRRKLELPNVPAPPKDLLARIQADIPEPEVLRHADPRRLRSPFLRIAASLILLAGTSWLFVRLVSPAREELLTPPIAARKTMAPAAATETVKTENPVRVASSEGASDVAVAPASMKDEQEGVTAAPAMKAAPPAPRPAAPVPLIAQQQPASNTTGAVVGSVAERDAYAPEPPAAMAEAVPPPPAPPLERRDQASNETAREELKATTRMAASAPAPAPPAAAGAVAPQRSRALANDDVRSNEKIFGISIDDASFARVRDTVARGERPAAASVNPEAFVNYFAGPAKSEDDVRLEVEGSQPVMHGSGRKVLLRLSVDTASAPVSAGAAAPPVARDAQIDIRFDSGIVHAYRRIGGDEELTASEKQLRKNTSVTAVYEIDLAPLAVARQRVVTVRLSYKPLDGGRTRQQEKTLHVNDFVHQWDAASRRHKLATLAGMLSEALQGKESGSDVAKRAQQLVAEEPRDPRAKELATVANAAFKDSARNRDTEEPEMLVAERVSR